MQGMLPFTSSLIGRVQVWGSHAPPSTASATVLVCQSLRFAHGPEITAPTPLLASDDDKDFGADCPVPSVQAQVETGA